MSNFSALPQAECLSSKELTAVTVTISRAQAFYDLIQEQAEELSSAHRDTQRADEKARELYQAAIAGNGINAFMVYKATQPLGAVTFSRCQTDEGVGLYLEDIVTTELSRGHGVGHFSMSILAQIALNGRYDHLLWECGEDKTRAQNFYTSLNAEICADRHTWRYFGTANGGLEKHDSNHYVCTPLTTEDIHSVIPLMQPKNIKHHAFMATWLSQQIKQADHDFVYVVARDKTNQEIVGFSVSYRSFSTFRAISGLHINGLFIKTEHPDARINMLHFLGNMQKERCWLGHTDITIHAHQSALLGALPEFGYERLAYGGKRMIVRRFGEAQLKATAQLHPEAANQQILNMVPAHPRLLDFSIATAIPG